MAVSKHKDSNASKKGPKAKRSLFESIPQYFKDVRSEFRKVIWPTMPEVKSSTVVVLTTLAFFSLIIGVLDLFFSRIIEFVIPLAG